MHSFLITALNILIFKFNRHKDIIIGTVNSGRNLNGLTNMLGMFVKTLPLRIKISKEDNPNTILKEVQEGVLQIDNNQDIPEEHLKKHLYDVLVVFQNSDFSYHENIKLGDAELTLLDMDVSYSKIPLLFNFFEAKNKLNGTLSFNTGKYDVETIKLITLKYKKLINEIILDQSTNINDLDILLDFEKQKIIDIDFNF